MRTLGLIALASICFAGDVWAQGKRANELQPAEIAEGWEQIDERLVFLIVRLANTETSLEAIENVIATETRKKTKVAAPKKANEGGGPMKWPKFYVTTAEKFFYHPTDRNSTYHTVNILSPQPPQSEHKTAEGIPSLQGLPLQNRPPQFDYIFRANEKAKARAEADAAAIKGNFQSLIERRNLLEAEQAGLWVKIAFQTVQHFDLDKKPTFRFEPIAEVRENAYAMKAAASFMATGLSIVNEADDDQAGTFSKIKPTISLARQELNDSWLRLGIDASDRRTNLGKFAALAKRLDDAASNLSESYLVAMEGDKAKDQQRKETFRGTLQESLISYAEIILALNEMSTLLKDEWKTKPALDKPLQFVTSKLIVSRSSFVGRWRALNAKGDTIFVITLDGEGSSQTTNAAGVTGKWEVVNKDIRITWNEGWRDIIRLEEDGYRKLAFKPGMTWEDKPHEILRIVRESTEKALK